MEMGQTSETLQPHSEEMHHSVHLVTQENDHSYSEETDQSVHPEEIVHGDEQRERIGDESPQASIVPSGNVGQRVQPWFHIGIGSQKSRKPPVRPITYLFQLEIVNGSQKLLVTEDKYSTVKKMSHCESKHLGYV